MSDCGRPITMVSKFLILRIKSYFFGGLPSPRREIVNSSWTMLEPRCIVINFPVWVWCQKEAISG
jgi:hypothetical protein